MDGIEGKGEKNSYSTQKAMQQYAALILKKLPMIDRVNDEKEMHRVIMEMLELLGKCTGADRVYIFDKYDDSVEYYTNTYEWCKSGVHSEKDNLQTLAVDDMPCWDKLFRNGETIVIRDLADIRETMPLEYAILKPQNIQSEIAAPIYRRNFLCGFIGLDNPYKNVSELFIQQLAFVGAHLSAARDNYRMFNRLEHQIEMSEKERQILMTLCRDSVSVYRVNLMDNTASIIKLEGYANSVGLLEQEKKGGLCYFDEITKYYHAFVIEESAPHLLEDFLPENLMKALADKDHLSRRFQSVPNDRGQIYFEIRATKIFQSEETFQILVDFRHIDDIIQDERRNQQKLTKALEEARMKNEIISAISKIYFLIYRINLMTDYFEDVSEDVSEDCGEQRMVTLNGRASEKMSVIQNNAVSEYRDALGRFLDLSTLAMRLGNDETIAVEYLAVDGNWHLARFIVQTRDRDGGVKQVLFVIRLISEEKRREKYLIGAMEDANRANEAKSEFLSRMSHDIRTPMNAIVGFTNIAQSNLYNPDKLQDCLDKIKMSSNNLQQLIDDVLDLSKIESGELKMTEEAVNISEICDLYRNTIGGMADEKKINYTVHMHDIFFNLVKTDSLRLGQIYMNLLSNAVKYTPEGGKVNFEIYEEKLPDPDKGKVRLISIVRDNGIGMSEAFMKKMYSRFSRAVDTRVNKVRGSGLGLAIVKEIVDMMGGTIEVESHEQKGTTFKVMLELPYLEEKNSGSNALENNQNLEEEIILPDRRLNILVAEDNDLNYEIIEEQLKMYGIHCVHAVNGKDCVEKFAGEQQETFDAILMDMQMPVMNGMEAADIIRRMPYKKASEIPIIALTANAYQEDIRKCLDAGMNTHLSKPVEIKTLLRTILKYIH